MYFSKSTFFWVQLILLYFLGSIGVQLSLYRAFLNPVSAFVGLAPKHVLLPAHREHTVLLANTEHMKVHCTYILPDYKVYNTKFSKEFLMK